MTNTWPWHCIPSAPNISFSVGPLCYCPQFQLALPFNVSLSSAGQILVCCNENDEATSNDHVIKCCMPNHGHCTAQYPQNWRWCQYSHPYREEGGRNGGAFPTHYKLSYSIRCQFQLRPYNRVYKQRNKQENYLNNSREQSASSEAIRSLATE